MLKSFSPIGEGLLQSVLKREPRQLGGVLSKSVLPGALTRLFARLLGLLLTFLPRLLGGLLLTLLSRIVALPALLRLALVILSHGISKIAEI